jgi:hypothetical protein
MKSNVPMMTNRNWKAMLKVYQYYRILLSNEVAWLHAKWNQYRQLYGLEWSASGKGNRSLRTLTSLDRGLKADGSLHLAVRPQVKPES